jgi:hypothetical protein
MSTINRRASKRRKRRTEREFHTPSASEERHLHQAIQNSKLDRSRQGDLDIPWGPTFYPTVEEMEASPLDFMEKIRPVAQRYGIYKIVPPKGWNPHPFSKCSRSYCTYDATDGVECVGFVLDIVHVEVISESMDALHRPS